jgi:hypothetical protein
MESRSRNEDNLPPPPRGRARKHWPMDGAGQVGVGLNGAMCEGAYARSIAAPSPAMWSKKSG